MKMKQFLSLAFGFFLAATFLYGEEKPTGWRPAGSFSTTFQERWLGLRISRSIHEGWMMWSDLYLNAPGGFYVDLWNSYPLENRESHGGDEFDVTLGWHKELPKKFEFDLSTVLFNLYPLDRWWDGDVAVQEASLARSFRFGDHVIRPQFIVDWISKTSDFAGGAIVLMPNVTHSWEGALGLKNLNLHHRAFIVWDDGFDGPHNDSDGIFFRWSAGLDWRITKNLTWTFPGFTALTPITHVDDGRKAGTSWSTALTLKF